MKEIEMIPQKEFDDDHEEMFYVDDFISDNAINLNLSKNISGKQSEIIMEIIERNRKNNGRVDWIKVLRQFEHSGDEKKALRKIKDHYYNKRSSKTHRNTKVKNYYLEKLGFRI